MVRVNFMNISEILFNLFFSFHRARSAHSVQGDGPVKWFKLCNENFKFLKKIKGEKQSATDMHIRLVCIRFSSMELKATEINAN